VEINHVLDVFEGQLVTYDADESLAKVNWWLDTPEGQLWGDPAWGNKLIQFNHDPISVSLDVVIEAHIYSKMSVDLPSVSIKGIRVVTKEMNQAQLILETPYGLIETTFDRSNNT
jgi:hypothetical protein